MSCALAKRFVREELCKGKWSKKTEVQRYAMFWKKLGDDGVEHYWDALLRNLFRYETYVYVLPNTWTWVVEGDPSLDTSKQIVRPITEQNAKLTPLHRIWKAAHDKSPPYRIFIVDMIVQIMNSKTGKLIERHSNVMLLNTELGTLEVFEPHGHEVWTDVVLEEIRHAQTQTKDAIWRDAKLIGPLDSCPRFGGPQIVTDDKLCGAWSSLYLYLRIKCPELTRTQVVRAMQPNKDPTKTSKVVRNWICYMLTLGKNGNVFEYVKWRYGPSRPRVAVRFPFRDTQGHMFHTRATLFETLDLLESEGKFKHAWRIAQEVTSANRLAES